MSNEKPMTQSDRKEIWEAIDRLRETVSRMGENMSAQITRVTENFNAQISELNKFIYQNFKKDTNGNPIMNLNSGGSGFDWKAVAACFAGIGLVCSMMFQIHASNNMQMKFLATLLEKADHRTEEHVKIGGHPGMSERASRLETEIAVARNDIVEVKDSTLPQLKADLNEKIDLKTENTHLKLEGLNQRLGERTASRYFREDADKDNSKQDQRINNLEIRMNNLDNKLFSIFYHNGLEKLE